jgi:hypothetical protein
MVVHVLLERARYKADHVWFGATRIDLQPGELIDSEEAIAKECGRGVTRKVVRTTIRRLEAGGFLARRRAHPAGQCPHVITILDYDRLRLRAADEGQRNGPPQGAERATDGPVDGQRPGQEGAPVEQREPPQPDEHANQSVACARDPLVAAFAARLADRLGQQDIKVGKDPDAVERFFADQIVQVGEVDLLADCVHLAKTKCGQKYVGHLSWFIPYLQRMPAPAKRNNITVTAASENVLLEDREGEDL